MSEYSHKEPPKLQPVGQHLLETRTQHQKGENEMNDNEAMLNITYNGMNGDLRDPVHFDATDAEIKAWATEAVRNGDVVGIDADPNVDFTDFVVDRFAAKDDLPARTSLRPKTPFGLSG
jgi:hypothetical protein